MIVFEDSAWEQYLEWEKKDLKKIKKINVLLKECLRTPFSGSGKPECLKGDYHGCWSRRIDHEHRLVYSFCNNILTIIACQSHYE